MINKILTGIMKLIISLVSVVMGPIDALISQFLPDLGNAINSIGTFFELATNSLGFCVSLMGLSSTALSLIVLYFTFKLSAPIVVSACKTAIKWYNALKP